MKKISALILILVLLFAMFSLTSCGSEEKIKSNSYEDSLRFIYGDSDAADFFVNFKPFPTIEAAIDGFIQWGKTVGNGSSNWWNKITNDFSGNPILYILAILLIAIVVVVCGIGVAFCFMVAFVIDSVFLIYYGLSLLLMTICRLVMYFLV